MNDQVLKITAFVPVHFVPIEFQFVVFQTLFLFLTFVFVFGICFQVPLLISVTVQKRSLSGAREQNASKSRTHPIAERIQEQNASKSSMH